MWWCGVRGRCAQSPLCGAFGEGVSVVGWWCFGEVSCLLKERGERMRQQSSEGGDDGEGVSECVIGIVVRCSLGVFAGEEEKKR